MYEAQAQRYCSASNGSIEIPVFALDSADVPLNLAKKVKSSRLPGHPVKEQKVYRTQINGPPNIQRKANNDKGGQNIMRQLVANAASAVQQAVGDDQADVSVQLAVQVQGRESVALSLELKQGSEQTNSADAVPGLGVYGVSLFCKDLVVKTHPGPSDPIAAIPWR